jgi:[glutamine synthetase] adenylyltransferase / [glutamine synthetase]-adenylyl-L-tyrosine phosphorylase
VSPELGALVERALAELGDAACEALSGAPTAIVKSIAAVFAASDFVAHACARDAQLLPELIESGDLQRPLAASEYLSRAPAPGIGPTEGETQAQSELRRWRRRELTRIAWRDLAGWANLS